MQREYAIVHRTIVSLSRERDRTDSLRTVVSRVSRLTALRLPPDAIPYVRRFTGTRGGGELRKFADQYSIVMYNVEIASIQRITKLNKLFIIYFV